MCLSYRGIVRRFAWLLLCLSVIAPSAAADEASEMRKQVVGTMLLTGRLVVAADGAITAHAIDQSGKVPPEVLRHVARYIPRWRVTRTGGGAGEKRFSVRVMAAPRGDGNFALSLVGASIVKNWNTEETIAIDGRLKRPDYPRSHGRAGVTGTVYVLVRLGRDGKVEDLITEQVNLNLVGAPAEVAQARADFAAHTAAAARQWKFRLPKLGSLAGKPFLVARVPVVYSLGRQAPDYGEWEYYVPGPRRVAPWVEWDDMMIAAGEAGVPQLLGEEPLLETPLEPPSG